MMLILRKMRHEYFSIGGIGQACFRNRWPSRRRCEKLDAVVRLNSPGSAERSKGRAVLLLVSKGFSALSLRSGERCWLKTRNECLLLQDSFDVRQKESMKTV